MITYELAKKLKDSGLYIRSSDLQLYFVDVNAVATWKDINNSVRVAGSFFPNRDEYVPVYSLEQLIEACGSKLKMLIPPKAIGSLETYNDCWFAVEKIGTIDATGQYTDWWFIGGSTPEEAVANLLLQTRVEILS